MATLIFGSKGFIGSHLVRYFSEQNHSFVAFSRSDCDFCDVDAVKSLIDRHDDGDLRIINASGICKTVSNTNDSFIKNITMAQSFITALHSKHITSFVHLSSFDVYDTNHTKAITENTPLHSTDWYSLDKITSESMFTFTPELQNVLTILRIPGVYALDTSNLKSIPARFLAKLIAEEALDIFGNGSTLRDLCHIDDVCKIIERITYHPLPCGIVNIATGKAITLSEIVEILAARVKKHPQIRYCPPSERSFDISVDITKLATLMPTLVPKDIRFHAQKNNKGIENA